MRWSDDERDKVYRRQMGAMIVAWFLIMGFMVVIWVSLR